LSSRRAARRGGARPGRDRPFPRRTGTGRAGKKRRSSAYPGAGVRSGHGWLDPLAVVTALANPILHRRDKERKMSKNRNFFQRAVDALVEGRTRQAERYVAQFERAHGHKHDKMKGR